MAQLSRRWFWAGLGGVAFLTSQGSITAAPTVAQVLAFAPRQAGVECTTPTAEQQAACKVNLVKGKKGSGWMLADAGGTPVRRFYDSNDDNKIDTWSYYKDGAEVYREIDTDFNAKPDQYRWFNTAGSRWGVDANEDGKIDSWKAISREEASQEILQAVTTGDYGRLQALLLTEAEVKQLEVSAEEAKKLQEGVKAAQAKFEEVAGKLKGKGKIGWLHFESGLPRTRPADAAESRFDLVRHPRGTVLFEADGKSDWLQTGEMVKFGDAWRLVDGPTLGVSTTVVEQAPATGGAVGDNPKLQKALEKLGQLDKASPTSVGPGPNAEIVKYSLSRADVLEEITALVPAKEREQWVRQVADTLSTAVQNSAKGEKVAEERLGRLEKQIVEAVPKSNLAAYVVYRHMQADYSLKLSATDADYSKLQQAWMDSLTKFVEAYPKCDDTADALLQLGMTCELDRKSVV